MTAQAIYAMLAGKLTPMLQDQTTEALQQDLADVVAGITFTISDDMELEVEI